MLGMMWIKGLVLFCVKFEICYHSLFCFPIFGLPHSTALDFIHVAFSSKYHKKSDSNVCNSKELSCSIFSWSDEAGEYQILPRIHKDIVSLSSY